MCVHLHAEVCVRGFIYVLVCVIVCMVVHVCLSDVCACVRVYVCMKLVVGPQLSGYY